MASNERQCLFPYRKHLQPGWSTCATTRPQSKRHDDPVRPFKMDMDYALLDVSLQRSSKVPLSGQSASDFRTCRYQEGGLPQPVEVFEMDLHNKNESDGRQGGGLAVQRGIGYTIGKLMSRREPQYSHFITATLTARCTASFTDFDAQTI